MEHSMNEKQLLELEHGFWNAMLSKDAERAGAMTDDECILVGAQGVSVVDGPAMARLTKANEWELKRYAFDEESTRVRFLADDIALVAYRVDERVVVNGETVPITANDASVWVRRDGQWRCALHTESLVGDPFGRDRTG